MNTQVAILMGSDSDLEVMKGAAEVLEQFGIGYEINVLSAHRTPHETTEYVGGAASKGVKVLIAGAGGAAHLAGVCAAHFAGPVIGIPVKAKYLDGLDSLLSTVQMPPGIPVATVGINAAKNAGLLAVKILAASDENLTQKLKEYTEKQTKKVLEKNAKLNEVGYKKYLEEN